MNKIPIKIKVVDPTLPACPLPEYTTEGSAGCDVRAVLKEPKVIPSGKFLLVPTNLSVEIPPGYEIQVRPRSGLAAKNGVTVLNTPGTIDSDYRGEIKVILINLGDEDFLINHGDRIAQLIVSKVYQGQFIQVDELQESTRGTGGFGSSGIS